MFLSSWIYKSLICVVATLKCHRDALQTNRANLVWRNWKRSGFISFIQPFKRFQPVIISTFFLWHIVKFCSNLQPVGNLCIRISIEFLAAGLKSHLVRCSEHLLTYWLDWIVTKWHWTIFIWFFRGMGMLHRTGHRTAISCQSRNLQFLESLFWFLHSLITWYSAIWLRSVF